MDSKELHQIANKMRYLALKAITCGGSGHPGGSLSLAEIMTAIYFCDSDITKENVDSKERDKVILSKGHACPILYAALCLKGILKESDLEKLRHIDGMLQGHPDMKHTPGVDMSTGSLGQGISAACGIALGLQKQNKFHNVYAILGDGELDEGQVWEALMFAAHYKLSNLIIIVDHNGLQIDGANSEVMDLLNLKDKFTSFGMNTLEIDGNNLDLVIDALKQAHVYKNGPTVILANTIKGKGVSFMENQVGWHGKAPSAEELEKAKIELGIKE